MTLTVDNPRLLLPRDPLGIRLCELFPYRWQAIVGINEPDPQWQTITKYPIRPRVLWEQWQDPNSLIGVRFGATTSYAMIDIDAESPYHPSQNPDSLSIIRAALETIGIYRTILLTSSHSGGLHLYLPLPIAVSTFGIAIAVKRCLEAQGIAIAPSQLEIFPNPKTYTKPGTYSEYNAHRLPLQPNSGSFLLDADGNPYSQDLRHFFTQWDLAASGQSPEELESAIAVARTSRRHRARSQRRLEEWRQDLLTEMQEGWTGYGQTNHLLKTIACYGVVFEGLKDEELSEYVLQTAIASPGYTTFCRHQHEIERRCRVWARSAQGYYWAIGEEPQRCNAIAPINLNQIRAENAQRRIQEAVNTLITQNALPIHPTDRMTAIAALAQTSSKTLYRYLELWHPEHCSLGCKTADAEPDSADFEEAIAELERSPEPNEDGEFSTFPPKMKCRDWNLEAELEKIKIELEKRKKEIKYSLVKAPAACRRKSSVTLTNSSDPLKQLWNGSFQKSSVTFNPRYRTIASLPWSDRDLGSSLTIVMDWIQGYGTHRDRPFVKELDRIGESCPVQCECTTESVESFHDSNAP